jgi:hypothetical protein
LPPRHLLEKHQAKDIISLPQHGHFGRAGAATGAFWRTK